DVESVGKGGGNLLTKVDSSASASVKIVYHYTPAPSLPPGDYVVVERDQPPGYLDGLDTNDNITPIPGSIGTDRIPVHLTNGDSPNNNFGELQPASVAGFVYHDANDNGRKDTGEPGISGVP